MQQWGVAVPSLRGGAQENGQDQSRGTPEVAVPVVAGPSVPAPDECSLNLGSTGLLYFKCFSRPNIYTWFVECRSQEQMMFLLSL